MPKRLIVFCSLLLLLVTPKPAHAYPDANTGSLLLQLLLGGLAGIALLGRIFWHRNTRVLGLGKGGYDES
jgi:hypothetical protein